MKSSTTLVTLGCAAAVAMALVGAAYAIDTPAETTGVEQIEKGDRAAPTVSDRATTLTIEEVNLDAGISNLVIIDTRSATAL